MTRRRLFENIGSAILSGFLILSILYFSYSQGLWRFNYPSLAEYPVQGLDVSHHQGEIDWAAVPRDRFQFVYIKASEGGDFRDVKFSENWDEAKTNKFQTGAYHFFTLCRPGIDQAKNFAEATEGRRKGLPPAIDLEFVGNCSKRPARKEFSAELNAFIKTLAKYDTQKPVFYTTENFYREYLQGSGFDEYPLWIRSVFSAPAMETEWAYWQYADNVRIPGINGPVDLNAAAN
jgi:lysozyme